MAYGYSAPYVNYRVDTDKVMQGLEDLTYRSKQKLKAYFEQEAAPYLRDYMVRHHKWTNRTFTAEKGLVANVITSGNMKRTDWNIRVELAHTATHNGYEYGKVLEGIEPYRNGNLTNRFGVMDDTLLHAAPEVVNDLAGFFDILDFR